MARGSKKTPQDKKRLSLKKDRRNVYGESPHGSRKSIPRNKRAGHSRVRAATNPELQIRGALPDEEVLDDLDQRVAAAQKAADEKRFKKHPDAPLGQVIEAKKKRRVNDLGAKERRRNERARRDATPINEDEVNQWIAASTEWAEKRRLGQVKGKARKKPPPARRATP